MNEIDKRQIIISVFNDKFLDVDGEYKPVWKIIQELADSLYDSFDIDGINIDYLKEKGYNKAKNIVKKYYNQTIKSLYDEEDLIATYETLKAYTDLAADYYLKELGV